MIYKLTLEYDGSGFHGWQAQPGRRTVEGEVRRALEVVTRQRSRLVAAGRTDAGAHALGQVVGVALELAPDLKRLQRSLNGLLPPEIAVVGVAEVAPTFHARFSARRRHYRYLVENRGVRPALLQGRAWHVRPTLDRTAMRAAASALTGRHDLGQFGKDPAGRSPVRSRERPETRRGRGGSDGDVI